MHLSGQEIACITSAYVSYPLCLNASSLQHVYWCATLSQVPSQALNEALGVVGSVTIISQVNEKNE